MIQHRAERIFCVVARRGIRNCFADRESERAGVFGVLREKFLSDGCVHRRRRNNLRVVRFHQNAAVRFLTIRNRDHVHFTFDVVQFARERKRAAPLSRARFGGDAFRACLFVVIRLRHGGIRFVRTRWRNAFVFEINVRGRVQRFLQTSRANQRRWTPQFVFFVHIFGNVHVIRRVRTDADLLHNQFHRKDRREIFGTHRLAGARVDNGRQRRRKIILNVVPLLGHFAFLQKIFCLVGHDSLLWDVRASRIAYRKSQIENRLTHYRTIKLPNYRTFALYNKSHIQLGFSQRRRGARCRLFGGAL